MSSPLSIVFCGTPEFAVPSLEALVSDAAFRVDLVVTQPDRPVGRSKEPMSSAVKILAQQEGIPVFQPEKLNAALEEMEHLIGHRPDFLVVVAYGQILSQKVLDFPRVAAVNVHGSLLPRWRGASPVEHAILAGDAETGVTVQVMVPALDAGPVLSQTPLTIGPRDSAMMLREKLSFLGATLLAETLKKPLQPAEQPKEVVTVCRKLSKHDGVCDAAAMTAEEIDRRVRALVPWPGVTVTIEGQPLKLLETSLSPAQESVPLPCRDGTTLHLLIVQPPSKKPMVGAAWQRGVQKM